MIDLTKSYKTRNGCPVINLVHSDTLLRGEIFFNGKWENFFWYLDGKCNKHFACDGDLIENEPQYIEHTRETLAEEANFFIDDGLGAWIRIERLLLKYVITSDGDNFNYKDLLGLKWANGPNKGRPVGRLQ